MVCDVVLIEGCGGCWKSWCTGTYHKGCVVQTQSCLFVLIRLKCFFFLMAGLPTESQQDRVLLIRQIMLLSIACYVFIFRWEKNSLQFFLKQIFPNGDANKNPINFSLLHQFGLYDKSAMSWWVSFYLFPYLKKLQSIY